MISRILTVYLCAFAGLTQSAPTSQEPLTSCVSTKSAAFDSPVMKQGYYHIKLVDQDAYLDAFERDDYVFADERDDWVCTAKRERSPAIWRVEAEDESLFFRVRALAFKQTAGARGLDNPIVLSDDDASGASLWAINSISKSGESTVWTIKNPWNTTEGWTHADKTRPIITLGASTGDGDPDVQFVFWHINGGSV
ncbi:hypothetical protein C8R46DRAFT_309818 [Mycena filopes]|nr:hypothetical protein C8R46DRAFT_309818 [Mycena filopes]